MNVTGDSIYRIPGMIKNFKKKLYKGNKRSYNGKAVEKRGKMKKGEENFFQKLLDRAKGSVID